MGNSTDSIKPGALLLVVLGFAWGPAHGADPDRPHEHRGVLAPYEEPPRFTLDDDQREDLGKGKLVLITAQDGNSGGRGIAVLDIAAPVDTVWSRITGFAHYSEWVGPVKSCEVYRTDGPDIYTRTKVSGFLYSFEYFLKNTIVPDEHLMTWTMDYDRRSDFDDCIGAWVVDPHPEKEGWSRAWFSSDLKLRMKLPGFLLDFIKKRGMKDATSWVKEQSELAMGIEIPTALDLQDGE